MSLTPPAPPPFTFEPAAAGCPVLVTVTHAGRDYRRELLAAARVPAGVLAGLEDPLVDALAMGVTDLGAGLLVAHAPRALIDLNRAPDEMEPGTVVGGVGLKPGPRARGGLGAVPTRLAPHGPLWRRALTAAEFATRVEGVHRPFHDAIAREMVRLRDTYGTAVLLDLHSMPPPPPGGADVVLGDRHGASCDAWVSSALAASARRTGLTVACNAPYAGGHVVARHGAPGMGMQAIQVELSRALYLGADGRRPGPGWADTRGLVLDLVGAAIDAVATAALQLAAE